MGLFKIANGRQLLVVVFPHFSVSSKLRHYHHHTACSRTRIAGNPKPTRACKASRRKVRNDGMKQSAVWRKGIAFSLLKGPSFRNHGIRRGGTLISRLNPALSLFACRPRSASFSGIYRPSEQPQRYLKPMGSDARLNEEDVLARFDRLVGEGTVVYNEDYRTVTVTDKGLPVTRPLIKVNPQRNCL